jgi:signal transduction histidine kinase
MKRRGRTRLSTRLYLVGVVQLLLVVLAAIAIGFAVDKLSRRGDVRAIAARLEAAAPSSGDTKGWQTAVDGLRAEDVLVSIYDYEGKLVASNVSPPLRIPRWARPANAKDWHEHKGGEHIRTPLLPQEWHDEPLPGPPGNDPNWRSFPGGAPPTSSSTSMDRHERRPPAPFGGPPPPDAYASFRVNGGDGVIVARFEPRKPTLVPPALTLAFGLGVFALGAWLTARWIARPLERLARTAQAIGKGDLNARAGFERTDELGRVGAAFDEMAERLQLLLTAEKELLANVAHELRTPLARIRVALEIASEGDAETARTSLGEIAVDLSELEAVVDDILTTARLEAAAGTTGGRTGFALHLEEVTPASIAERAAERLRERHPERPLTLRIANELDVIEADPVLFRRVIDNLLENAHKYSPDTSKPIVLGVNRRDGGVAFDVSDGGLGIPEEDLPRIFTAFFRGERSRSRGTGGVGLGLTLAKRIVEAHGGTIDVKSTVGEGTSVTVVVPVRAQTPPSSLSSSS